VLKRSWVKLVLSTTIPEWAALSSSVGWGRVLGEVVVPWSRKFGNPVIVGW